MEWACLHVLAAPWKYKLYHYWQVGYLVLRVGAKRLCKDIVQRKVLWRGFVMIWWYMTWAEIRYVTGCRSDLAQILAIDISGTIIRCNSQHPSLKVGRLDLMVALPCLGVTWPPNLTICLIRVLGVTAFSKLKLFPGDLILPGGSRGEKWDFISRGKSHKKSFPYNPELHEISGNHGLVFK